MNADARAAVRQQHADLINEGRAAAIAAAEELQREVRFWNERHPGEEIADQSDLVRMARSIPRAIGGSRSGSQS